MKGFFITIKNGLLDPKHIKAMHGEKGGSIWLFMWCLDKMTIIDHEKGEGKVLGGKPVKYEEVKQSLGIGRRTYQRWLDTLRKGGYISTIKAPGGLKITVYKAWKIFGQKIRRGTSVVPQVAQRCAPSGTSNIRQDNDKTIRQDNIGFSKKTARKEIKFNKDDYNKVITAYEELKEVKFQGREYEPIQQEIKTMFLSGRQPEEIINCMRWFSKKAGSGQKDYVWTESWTIRTIRLKIALFLAGQLEKKEQGIRYKTYPEILKESK